MKPEDIVLEVLLAISEAPFEYRGSFSHLDRKDLFQFLLAPRAGIEILLIDAVGLKMMPWFDAAYNIAHYEVVVALQKEFEVWED